MINVCKFCGKEYEWDGIRMHPIVNKKGNYNAELYCSYECRIKASKQKEFLTNLEKYGVRQAWNRPESHIARKKTMLEKYGVENPIQCEEIRKKMLQTTFDRYGVQYVMQSKEIQKRTKLTNLKKYGTENPAQSLVVQEKMKSTNLKKYGVENVYQSEEKKEKIKQTKLEKYGDENYLNSEQRKRTNINRYGTDNPLNSKYIQEKIHKTNLERYGVENPLQSKYIQDKARNTMLQKYGAKYTLQIPEIKEKIKNTLLHRYGVTHNSQAPGWQQAVYETKKKNKSFTASKFENTVKPLLKQKWQNTQYQHKSAEYPWQCDFYIQELNLYIELQGHICHWIEPYNPDNTEHQQLVEIWREKSKEINHLGKPKQLYERMIEGWTVGDPKKRQWAKDHNLNWLEFFTIEQFMEWYNAQ